MSDYLELALYLDEDEGELALVTVHLAEGGSFLIPQVTGDLIRSYGSWMVPCLSLGKPSRALIPADKVAYFTATSYVDLYGRNESDSDFDDGEQGSDSLGDDELELATLENSDVRLYVHNEAQCFGEVCTIHNRSSHHMRDFRQHWRGDRGIMERTCEHGVGHPDPDDYRIYTGDDHGVHGCDGCCKPLNTREQLNLVEDLTEELL
jgi:hypothetical protein